MRPYKKIIFLLCIVAETLIAGNPSRSKIKKNLDMLIDPTTLQEDIKPIDRFVFSEGIVFVTCADTEHYPILQHLLKSIYKYQSPNLQQILIFDLGLTQEERQSLNGLQKIKVCDIEPVNTDLFVKFRTRASTPRGKPVRGWYSWKPVILKQALEMFPYIMYVDATITIKKRVDILFEYTKRQGHLIIDCGHSIREMCTTTAKNIFALTDDNDSLLDTFGLWAGFQCLSWQAVQDYVNPIYQLAFDINNFVDDGTAPGGFGFARHDQLLFSIQARLKNMAISPREGYFYLKIDEKTTHQFKINEYIDTKPLWWINHYD